ncbi:hypothetical protein [Microbacterium maritypicum]|uniref:hypothetical protein n=2 Tax=Microbacterium TaxID=33882 RepID=UPI00296E32BB|nr:hypothetical protein [Microbacterium liquefaciens]
MASRLGGLPADQLMVADTRDEMFLAAVEGMFIVGLVAAVFGIVVFHVALGESLRANPTEQIPMGRRPKVSPRGSVQLRALGAGLIVLGAVLMRTAGWHWTAMVLLAGPVAALVAIGLHNRRVSRGAS